MKQSWGGENCTSIKRDFRALGTNTFRAVKQQYKGLTKRRRK